MLEPTYEKPSVRPHSYTLTSKRVWWFLKKGDGLYFIPRGQCSVLHKLNEGGLICQIWQVPGTRQKLYVATA